MILSPHTCVFAAQVDIQAGNPRISNGDLPETYHLAQFHFHWGSTNNRGSEHTLRGQQYPMEVRYSCLVILQIRRVCVGLRHYHKTNELGMERYHKGF